MKQTIHRTRDFRKNIQDRIKTRAPFLFGRQVKIGMAYAGFRSRHSTTANQTRTVPLFYDEYTKTLLAQTPTGIAFLEGDCVVWKNIIVSERGGWVLALGNNALDTIQAMLSTYTDRVPSITAAFRKRFPRYYSLSSFESVARMYVQARHLRTIEYLANTHTQRVIVYLRDETTQRLFAANAEREGYTHRDGVKISRRPLDYFFAINRNKTINYINFIGRVAFQCNDPSIVRVDYKKYITGEEDYLYHHEK